MVLESLLDTVEVLKKPKLLVAYGFLVTLASVFISNIFFPHVSLLTIAFITIASAHILHGILSFEEKSAINTKLISLNFLERNLFTIKVYGYFSLGIILAYAFLYCILPENQSYIIPSRYAVFSEQEKTLQAISELSKHNVAYAAANFKSGAFAYWFVLIFTNNIMVMLAAALLSFVFGAGAAFLISWNSSVIGTWIGECIKNNSLKFFGILPHALPEFAGYFLAATAGGLISVAITKKRKFKHEIEIILGDAIVMLSFGIASIALGALIEASAIAGLESISAVFTAFYLLLLILLILKLE